MKTAPATTEFRREIAEISAKTDRCLLADTLQLVHTEKKTQVELIMHLAEVAQRRLHLDQGYASMFDYCQRALNLAEGEIWLRLQVSSCCQRYPEVLGELAAGTISLTVAGKISAHLRAENKESLIAVCRGKSSREVEEQLAALKPKTSLPSSLRRCARSTLELVAREHKSEQESELRLSNEREMFANSAARCADAAQAPAPSLLSPGEAPLEERYNLRCTITASLRRKIERLAEVVGIDNPIHNLTDLLEQAVDIALKAKDPARPRRKSQTPVKIELMKQAQCNTEVPQASPPSAARSRNIPAVIRRAVFERGEFRCQFHSLDGQRCSQRTHLCIDHIVPYAQNGSHDLDNLQLLCSSHNRRKAERDFGWGWKGAKPLSLRN